MRLPVRRSSALLASVLVLAMAGCQPQGPIVGGPAHLPKKISTLVSLSPDGAELSQYCSAQLVGRSAADDFPATVQRAPVVSNVKPEYEKIAALKPDAILYDASLFNATDVQKLKDLNITLLPIEGDTVQDVIKCFYKIGAATLSESNFNTYINRIENAISVAQGDAITPKPKAILLLASRNANPMIAGTDSFYADLVRQAGADMVGPKSNKFEPTNPEALLALNPDIIVVAADKGDFTVVTKDPRYAALKAVKEGKVPALSPDLVLRRGQRIDKAIEMIHGALKQVSDQGAAH